MGTSGGFSTTAQRKERRDFLIMAANENSLNDAAHRSFDAFHSDIGYFQNGGERGRGSRYNAADLLNGDSIHGGAVPSRRSLGGGMRHGGGTEGGRLRADCLGISIGGQGLTGQQMLKDQAQRFGEAAAAAAASVAATAASATVDQLSQRQNLDAAKNRSVREQDRLCQNSLAIVLRKF